MTSQNKCFLISPAGEKSSATRNRLDDLMNYTTRPVMEGLEIKLERASKLAERGKKEGRLSDSN
ncbi:MAG: hypothetical protein M0Z77_09125 [Thermoplasmatales archaeon]|jgi:hypothetical protein|nr:hypothetical protein [Thermoplasmatales archaeon]